MWLDALYGSAGGSGATLGTNGYWPSHDETTFNQMETPPQPQRRRMFRHQTTDTMVPEIGIAIIIVVILVGAIWQCYWYADDKPTIPPFLFLKIFSN